MKERLKIELEIYREAGLDRPLSAVELAVLTDVLNEMLAEEPSTLAAELGQAIATAKERVALDVFKGAK